MDFVFHPDGIKDDNRFHWAGRAGGAGKGAKNYLDRIYWIYWIFCLLFSISTCPQCFATRGRRGRNSKLQIASRRGEHPVNLVDPACPVASGNGTGV